MDVQLNYLGSGEAPTNTFVSLRIGDVQKQARLSANRNFRFARVDGDGKASLSKLEVFKRVGSAVVNLSSIDAGSLQNVKVLCEDPSLGAMAFQLGVNVGQQQQQQQPGPNSGASAAAGAAAAGGGKKAEMKQRKDAAQAYLNEHGLETVLAEAVRDVIAAKPLDPFGFLAQRFMKRATGQTIPEATKPAPPVPSPTPAPAPVAMPAPGKEQKSAPAPESKSAAPPAQQENPADMRGNSNQGVFRNGHPVQKQPSKPEDQNRSSSRFSSYGLVQMPGIPKLEALYMKFPAYAKVATWYSPLSHKRQGAFQAETKAAANQAPGSNGFAILPSVGTWLLPAPKSVQVPQAAKTAQSSRQNFETLPSVGTWLLSAPKAANVTATKSAASAAFAILPSVGTWLMPPPRSSKAATSAVVASTVGTSSNVKKESSTATTASTTTLSHTIYGVQPSVCSWFKPLKQTRRSAAAAAAKELGKKRFAFSPSVGSWLMAAPTVVP